MNYEQAHEKFIAQHLASRTGERRGGWREGMATPRNYFCRMSGGRFVVISIIFIRSMRCWIYKDELILLILLFAGADQAFV